MSEQPLVSIVTATYNMAQYVVEAVDSILAQTYPQLEAVVVDDGSQDNTQEVLARYAEDPRVKIIHQDNAGQTAAKNRGLAACTGRYVGFCDADNAWLPDKIATQLEAFQGDNPPGVVYGDVQFIDDQGADLPTPRVQRHSGRITGPLLANNFVPFNTCLVPRDILTEVGGFDESLSMAIDYDLWLRISTRYEFRYLPQILARYRIWGGQMSHRTGERLDNALRMMEKFLREHSAAVTPGEARRAWAYTYTTRGLWLARMGKRSEAMSDYQRALEQHPTDLRAWKSLVRLIVGR
jgi:glycosyltransferase involved in cell wall biosynthesis